MHEAQMQRGKRVPKPTVVKIYEKIKRRERILRLKK